MSKQCLDVQQMQHLQELGLDTSNASMYWISYNGISASIPSNFHLPTSDNDYVVCDAYTLQDVLDAMPKYYHIANIGWTKLSIRVHTTKEWEIGYVYTDELSKYAYQCRKTEKNLIDAAYSLLCWCIENGYLDINKNE